MKICADPIKQIRIVGMISKHQKTFLCFKVTINQINTRDCIEIQKIHMNLYFF